MADLESKSGTEVSAQGGIAAPAEKAAKVIPPVTAERFADVTSSVHRFAARMTQFEPFQDASISMAEWSLLSEIRKEGTSYKKLQKNLGLTKQRLKQMRERLRKAGFVAVGAGGEENDAAPLTLTPLGETELGVLNGKLTELLARRLAGRERSFDQVEKGLRAMMRVFGEPKEKGAKPDEAAHADGADE
jgi:DNA-binding MarR family transcriptional regulator